MGSAFRSTAMLTTSQSRQMLTVAATGINRCSVLALCLQSLADEISDDPWPVPLGHFGGKALLGLGICPRDKKVPDSDLISAPLSPRFPGKTDRNRGQ